MNETIRIGGIELRFLQVKEETDASIDLFEMTLQPGGRMPVPHYHESWDETVYGLNGTMTWSVAGLDIDLVPNDSVFIRRGVVHGFSNQSGQPATCLCILTPGKLGLTYFREMASLFAIENPDLAKMKEMMLRHGLVPVAPA